MTWLTSLRANIATTLTVLLTVACLGLGGWAWWLKGRNDDLRAAVSGYEEAVRIRRKSDEEQARLKIEAAEIDIYLDTQEGGDAPLSDYLSDAAGKLWP
ncbi:hypothetical protein CEW89_08345 [Celeribacter ethanolicus]|uniref:Uncharacterized protein n=1 Tax=Celeribacter ethanolicus TaxID=1758178 RepID=A0A291GC29_9RHOB|nr:hypothetical protein [Celeribacter ethanolicus]ATG47582.1 hypothetical protein CEW89_08345 [Celeribacter ethanolicus]